MNKENRIKVLDCTLRDGGYVNDWCFGDENAQRIVEQVSQSGVDYVELAFIRNCEYKNDILEFSDMSQVTKLFRPSNNKLAIMVEIGYGYPIDMFPKRSEQTVDLVRLVVWKRMIKESFEYAKALLNKGYEVAIQATRTDQYTLEEFAQFIKLFSKLDVTAIYIVDTFGLFTKDMLLSYATVADENLTDNIRIGYHAHNNMQQAFSNMVALAEHTWNHKLMIDASVMGIGRGAGNLCLELFVKYLNEKHKCQYDEDILYQVADIYISPIFQNIPWGYSVPYLLSAKYGRNPSFVPYLLNKNISITQMAKVFDIMRSRGEGIRFDTNMCDNIVKEII